MKASLVYGLLPLLALGAAPAPQDRTAPLRCEAGLQRVVEGLTLEVAERVAAGPAPAGSGGPNGDPANPMLLPGHCLLRGDFERRTGVAGKPYAIRIELRVPDDWNGRLLFQGGSGLNGRLPAAVGRHVTNGGSAPVALARDFAVVTTDSGHTDPASAAFADDQQAKLNYAYASIGKVAGVARTLLAAMTGHGPERSYYAGCSNGGREAMIAAQRFPTEFDGVVAGNPAFHISQATVLAAFAQDSYARVAPKGPDGVPMLARTFTAADTRLIADGVLKQCDALDGLKDGMVFDHAACRFDPRVLACRAGARDGCVAPAKIAAIRRVFAGPRDARGGVLIPSYPWDAGIGADGWRLWQTGLELADGRVDASRTTLTRGGLAQLMLFPPVDPATLATIAPPALLARVAPTAALIDADSTQLTSFAARGGRMLMVTGWSDPVFSVDDLIGWYGRLGRDMGAATGRPIADTARLFLVPGMNHCGGGPALDDFDALARLVDWVEHGVAPDAIPATGKAFPGVSRPLCAFPKVATFRGGDPKAAASFTCA